VLARKLGIPITLSVVCLEVGRRAGVPLEGVGMPGHFLLRPVDGEHYVDAFAGGALLDLTGCETLFRSATGAGAGVTFGPHLLGTASTADMLARILQNLRVVYRRSVRPAEVEWVLRMLLALPGTGAAEVLELGSTLGQQGRFLDGAAVLESGTQQFPQHAEALGYAARGLRAHLN
jgi:regulator of sirC expression with transglutaminase-like and TPR domain